MAARTEQIAASPTIRFPRIRLRKASLWAAPAERGREGRVLAASLARNPVATGRETGARC